MSFLLQIRQLKCKSKKTARRNCIAKGKFVEVSGQYFVVDESL